MRRLSIGRNGRLTATHGFRASIARMVNAIVSRGENVFHGEVEDALAEHSAVTDAVVGDEIPRNPEWKDVVPEAHRCHRRELANKHRHKHRLVSQ